MFVCFVCLCVVLNEFVSLLRALGCACVCLCVLVCDCVCLCVCANMFYVCAIFMYVMLVRSVRVFGCVRYFACCFRVICVSGVRV